MKRNRALLEKRNLFILNYLNANQQKPITQIVQELTEKLFLSEKTIYNIIRETSAVQQLSQ